MLIRPPDDHIDNILHLPKIVFIPSKLEGYLWTPKEVILQGLSQIRSLRKFL